MIMCAVTMAGAEAVRLDASQSSPQLISPIVGKRGLVATNTSMYASATKLIAPTSSPRVFVPIAQPK